MYSNEVMSIKISMYTFIKNLGDMFKSMKKILPYVSNNHASCTYDWALQNILVPKLLNRLEKSV